MFTVGIGLVLVTRALGFGFGGGTTSKVTSGGTDKGARPIFE
jgi:hypothetical protein